MIKNKFLLVLIILTSHSVFLESSDLVIKNAEIYDGIENNPYQGHILINDGVVTKISKTSVPYADKVYDANSSNEFGILLIGLTIRGMLFSTISSATKDASCAPIIIKFSL